MILRNESWQNAVVIDLFSLRFTDRRLIMVLCPTSSWPAATGGWWGFGKRTVNAVSSVICGSMSIVRSAVSFIVIPAVAVWFVYAS